MDILTLKINWVTYLLKHLYGGTKVNFSVSLLCTLWPLGSAAGHWVGIPCLAWDTATVGGTIYKHRNIQCTH